MNIGGVSLLGLGEYGSGVWGGGCIEARRGGMGSSHQLRDLGRSAWYGAEPHPKLNLVHFS